MEPYLQAAGRWYLRNQGLIAMRLLSFFPNFRTLFVAPIFAAMLAVPAAAEPNAGTPPDTSSAAQTEPLGDDSLIRGNDPAPAQSEPAIDDSRPEAPVGPPKSSVLINVDKSTQEMTVFVDGIEQYRWPVSTGKNGYSSPTGDFNVSSMNKIWYSKQWDNAPMPHAIFFTKNGHAIHGTTDVKLLGNAASKGCVRLAPKNAETLFNLVSQNGMENAQVVLAGVTKGGEGPKVASTGPRKPQAYPPWFDPRQGYYMQPQERKKRRGLFGRRLFQPETQGYYAPRAYPRGESPRY